MSGRPESNTTTIGMPALFRLLITPRSSGDNERDSRSPRPSAYGVSPMTTTAMVAPLAPAPSAEKVTLVSGETAFFIALRIVVPPEVTGPLRPCQSMVHPPH